MSKYLIRSTITSLLVIVTTAVTLPTTETAAYAGAQKDFSFSLVPLAEKPGRYSLVISSSSEDERTISGDFSIDQLQILRAIMLEAERFALSGEAVGNKDPITTRFTDKQERAFIVDVQKAGNQSLLFLTLTTAIGRTTIEAGRAFRATRREEGFFFDLLSRLESTLPKLPAQSGK